MIAIIDYGMGNVGSVKNALEFLGYTAVLTRSKDEIEKASHIILPGVGSFGDGMQNLNNFGLVDILNEQVLKQKKPILGICLGMQMMADIGHENGTIPGLAWVHGAVRRFAVDEKKYPIPHTGWNDVKSAETAKLFQGIKKPIFYFVHSYFLEPHKDEKMIVAVAEHGEPFVAALELDNIFGVQFHPEKSQESGIALLDNFLHI